MLSSAERGSLLGLIFIGVIACLVGELYAPALALVLLILLILVPCLVFVWLKKFYLSSECTYSFWTLWFQGICYFIFASLIMSVGIYIFFKLAAPNFFSDLINYLVQEAPKSGDPMAMQQVESINELIAQNGMPRTIDFALSFGWLSVFSGIILTLILVPVIKLMYRNN